MGGGGLQRALDQHSRGSIVDIVEAGAAGVACGATGGLGLYGQIAANIAIATAVGMASWADFEESFYASAFTAAGPGQSIDGWCIKLATDAHKRAARGASAQTALACAAALPVYVAGVSSSKRALTSSGIASFSTKHRIAAASTRFPRASRLSCS